VLENQEYDLEVAWQAGSMTDTRDVHLNGIDVALVDPFLPDGDGLELIREVSVANPNASKRRREPVRSRCSPRTLLSKRSSTL
jgi:DNA-binding response OmpR family regulator